jgi:hypothetical protein
LTNDEKVDDGRGEFGTGEDVVDLRAAKSNTRGIEDAVAD